MDKREIAAIFEEIADLLEMKNANPFRVRAYRNAARSLLNASNDLEEMIRDETLTELEGIGDDLAGKIETLATKGKLPFYEKLKKSIPAPLLKLRQIEGLGPKKVLALYKKLKISSLEELRDAAQKGKIAKLKGFGAKTEQNILHALEHHERYQKRTLWWEANLAAQTILGRLRKFKGVNRAEIAGSLRRKLETIGDLDFVASSTKPKAVMDWFTQLPEVEKIVAKGETKSTVRLKNGMQADLRIVSPQEFGFALVYFTGSKEHNIKIRNRSLKRGWSLSEYGFEPLNSKAKNLFSKKREVSEEEIYQALSLPFIEPEMREDRGEIEAAEKGKLPKLIELKDLRGSFHNHTTASDGKSNLKEMVAYAEKLGWEYLGISDHSKSSFQANGLDEERLLKQIEEIRRFKSRLHLFAGSECDILPNGKMDFSDSILKKLDFVIASVHSSLTQDEKTMTARIIRAIEHPCTTMLGHITGRLLLKRESSKVNVEKVIDACIANKKIIEINGNPMRLELDWRYLRKAAEKGLTLCINCDAHAEDQLEYLLAGVNVARKGWLKKSDVINTLPLKEMIQYLKNRRR